MFVYFNHVDFESFLTKACQVAGARWIPVQKDDCFEYVYDVVVPGFRYSLRLYSSVSMNTGWSRPKGGDAIRVCTFDRLHNRFKPGSRKVLRVENWRKNLATCMAACVNNHPSGNTL